MKHVRQSMVKLSRMQMMPRISMIISVAKVPSALSSEIL
jgi:hypothetical protein